MCIIMIILLKEKILLELKKFNILITFINILLYNNNQK